MQESYYLLQALEEAQKGRGFCAPNPAVGAVAVQNQQIIARGYHHGAGQAHAEVECLSQIPANTPNVTLYITLEPCNHFGRTPPCVNAIIAHGIKRVVYGMRDPNLVVRSLSSDDILNQQGILSDYHPMPEITAFYQSYVYWTQYQRPWVSLKWAQTLDAKNGLKDEAIHFTHQEVYLFTHQQRYLSDALLTSAQTLITDQAQFTARIAQEVLPKPLMILDRTLRLTGMEKCFLFKRPIFIFHDKAYIPHFHHPDVQYIAMDTMDGFLNLSAILEYVGAMGVQDLWVEAGSRLTAALHERDLVNTTHIYIAPLVFGKSGTEAYQLPFDAFQKPFDIQWIPMGRDVRALINWSRSPCLQD